MVAARTSRLSISYRAQQGQGGIRPCMSPFFHLYLSYAIPTDLVVLQGREECLSTFSASLALTPVLSSLSYSLILCNTLPIFVVARLAFGCVWTIDHDHLTFFIFFLSRESSMPTKGGRSPMDDWKLSSLSHTGKNLRPCLKFSVPSATYKCTRHSFLPHHHNTQPTMTSVPAYTNTPVPLPGQKNYMPPNVASLPYHQRPLPPGWVSQFDPTHQANFYIGTLLFIAIFSYPRGWEYYL